MSWTRGPWVVHPKYEGVVCSLIAIDRETGKEHWQEIARCETDGGEWTESAEANARLITKAPEMASLLELIQGVIGDDWIKEQIKELLAEINNEP